MTVKPSPGAKLDEVALWAALEAGEQPRYAGPRLGIPPRRVDYLCEKWARQGIYDYGVVCDLGWINERRPLPSMEEQRAKVAAILRGER